MRPSQILEIKNSYDAFCFDEACEFIIQELENKKTPNWDNEEKSNNILKSKSSNKETIEWMLKHSKTI